MFLFGSKVDEFDWARGMALCAPDDKSGGQKPELLTVLCHTLLSVLPPINDSVIVARKLPKIA